MSVNEPVRIPVLQDHGVLARCRPRGFSQGGTNFAAELSGGDVRRSDLQIAEMRTAWPALSTSGSRRTSASPWTRWRATAPEPRVLPFGRRAERRRRFRFPGRPLRRPGSDGEADRCVRYLRQQPADFQSDECRRFDRRLDGSFDRQPHARREVTSATPATRFNVWPGFQLRAAVRAGQEQVLAFGRLVILGRRSSAPIPAAGLELRVAARVSAIGGAREPQLEPVRRSAELANLLDHHHRQQAAEVTEQPAPAAKAMTLEDVPNWPNQCSVSPRNPSTGDFAVARVTAAPLPPTVGRRRCPALASRHQWKELNRPRSRGSARVISSICCWCFRPRPTGQTGRPGPQHPTRRPGAGRPGRETNRAIRRPRWWTIGVPQTAFDAFRSPTWMREIDGRTASTFRFKQLRDLPRSSGPAIDASGESRGPGRSGGGHIR